MTSIHCKCSRTCSLKCVDDINVNVSFIGSSHSDKEVDPNTPEKVPRTTSERKRKRKVDDTGVVVAVQVGGKGARTASGDKKINDYFVKHAGNSPIRIGGAKSPSPQQGYPMVNNLNHNYIHNNNNNTIYLA